MSEISIEEEGLKLKYEVYKSSTGELVKDCFVLRPDKDSVAVAALTAYAYATNNKALATDILKWIKPDKRVAWLPCELGATVYTIEDGEIKNHKCNGFEIYGRDGYPVVSGPGEWALYGLEEFIGTDDMYYLSYEEAANKLESKREEGVNNNHHLRNFGIL